MTTDTVGGVWRYALELARGLGERGVEVALAAMGARLTDQQWAQAKSVPGLTVHESDFKLEWMPEPWEDVAQAGEWLLELERQLEPEVVHLNQYAHGTLPWRAPALVVGHSCVLSWCKEVRDQVALPEWDRYRMAVARGLRGAALVAAPSRTMLGWLQQYCGGFDRWRVIYHGRRTQFQTRPKEPFVLAVARVWDEAKNIGTLDAVAPHVPWPVYVAGERQHPHSGLAEVPNVHGLGWLNPEELASWFERASIYALPARYEPFGLSALEAAQAGCALVLGDIPSLREIWGDAAWFVGPNDAEGLTKVLGALIWDEEMRTERAQRALVRAQEFTLERMVDGYLDCYQELMARTPEYEEGWSVPLPRAA